MPGPGFAAMSPELRRAWASKGGLMTMYRLKRKGLWKPWRRFQMNDPYTVECGRRGGMAPRKVKRAA